MEKNTRKTEIVALLGLIEKANAEYIIATRKADDDARDLAKLFVVDAARPLKVLTLHNFENRTWYSEPSYEFDFRSENGYSLIIKLQSRKISAWSASGLSGRQPTDEKLSAASDFYTDVAALLSTFSATSVLESFFADIVPQFVVPDWNAFSAGLNESELKKELHEIEMAEKAAAIDLKEGSVVQFYFTSSKRYARDCWIIVKVTKVTPKTFSYRRWSERANDWLPYPDTVKIDWNRINAPGDVQLKMVEGK